MGQALFVRGQWRGVWDKQGPDSHCSVPMSSFPRCAGYLPLPKPPSHMSTYQSRTSPHPHPTALRVFSTFSQEMLLLEAGASKRAGLAIWSISCSFALPKYLTTMGLAQRLRKVSSQFFKAPSMLRDEKIAK